MTSQMIGNVYRPYLAPFSCRDLSRLTLIICYVVASTTTTLHETPSMCPPGPQRCCSPTQEVPIGGYIPNTTAEDPLVLVWANQREKQKHASTALLHDMTSLIVSTRSEPAMALILQSRDVLGIDFDLQSDEVRCQYIYE